MATPSPSGGGLGRGPGDSEQIPSSISSSRFAPSPLPLSQRERGKEEFSRNLQLNVDHATVTLLHSFHSEHLRRNRATSETFSNAVEFSQGGFGRSSSCAR